MTSFVTSDLHFGHHNIVSYAGRPVSNITEHNEFIIDRWNSTVGFNDTVYVLGDVAMGKIAETLPLVDELNGNKILVMGNRVFPLECKDPKRWYGEYLKYFNVIVESMVVDINVDDPFSDPLPVLFHHFPYFGDHTGEERYIDQRPPDNGLWLCHGHTHSSEFFHDYRMLHIGVDSFVANYAPISFKTISTEIKQREADK